jgi:hypothetical protein
MATPKEPVNIPTELPATFTNAAFLPNEIPLPIVNKTLGPGMIIIRNEAIANAITSFSGGMKTNLVVI